MAQTEARNQLRDQRTIQVLVAAGDRYEVEVGGDVTADREQNSAFIAACQGDRHRTVGAQRIDGAPGGGGNLATGGRWVV